MQFCPQHGTKLVKRSKRARQSRDPLLGTILDDRYKIVDKLGDGAMGVVYRAIQLSVKREVAIKVIRLDASDADFSKQQQDFIGEAQIVASFTHPNIVTLHEFGTADDGMFFMVMELLVGRTLATAYQKGDLTPLQLVQMAIQTLDALEHAHRRGVIHRDIKPANLMLLDDADHEASHWVKVLDFGVATITAIVLAWQPWNPSPPSSTPPATTLRIIPTGNGFALTW